MKYRTLEKTVDGVKFVFVTRGRAKLFTEDEVENFLKDRVDQESLSLNLETKDAFSVPDSVRLIFLKDMRQFGIAFCVCKYGATAKEIAAEATRIAPFMRNNYKI